MKRVFFLLLTVLFISGQPARADQPPFAPSPIALDVLLQRISHARGTLATGSYRIVERLTSANGEVTTLTTHRTSAGFETTETAPDATSSWGSLHGQSWIRDANGFVRTVSGTSSEHDPIVRALRDPRDPSSGATLLGISAGPPAEFVVELAPAAGLKELRYYDQQTYLLARTELTDYDGKTRTVRYEDYRPVSGSMVAFSWTEGGDMAPNSRHYIVDEYAPARENDALLAIPASKSPFAWHGSEPVTMPADFTSSGIVVRMQVGDRGLDLLLDSGASSIVIDASAAQDLHVASHDARAASMGGIYTVADARLSDVSVGSLHADSLAVNVAPVDTHVSTSERVVGLLGCDFIASGALAVDFSKKTLTLYPSAPTDLEAKGWTPLDVTLDNCVPMVKATISGKEGQFVLDLGAYSTILYPHFFAGYGTPDKNVPDTAAGRFIGGKLVRFKQYHMRSVVLGGLEFTDALVMVPNSSTVQQRSYDGLIGRTWLSNFNLLFDYAHQRVYIKPAE